MFNKKITKQIEDILTSLEGVRLLYVKLSEDIEKLQISDRNISTFDNRLKVVELWQNHLHNLMIEKTPTGKEKVSKRFGYLQNRL